MDRDPYHNLSGPRLPVARGSRKVECFRCTEERRILRLYTVRLNGRTAGSMLLCDICASALLPLDPDPLNVTEAA